MSSKSAQDLMERAYSLGFEYEKKYGGCAQCVLAALQDVLALRNAETDAIFKSATSLAGGVGSEGDGHCGAYSGGVLMLGYTIGRERENFADPEGVRQKTNALVQELHMRFIERYGTVICHSIHRKIFGRPYYLVDEEERSKFYEAGAHEDKCTAVVGEAARWTIQILSDAGYLSKVPN